MSVADGRADRTDRLSVFDYAAIAASRAALATSDNVGPTAVRRKVDANTGVYGIAVDMRSEVDLYEVPGLELAPCRTGRRSSARRSRCDWSAQEKTASAPASRMRASIPPWSSRSSRPGRI